MPKPRRSASFQPGLFAASLPLAALSLPAVRTGIPIFVVPYHGSHNTISLLLISPFRRFRPRRRLPMRFHLLPVYDAHLRDTLLSAHARLAISVIGSDAVSPCIEGSFEVSRFVSINIMLPLMLIDYLIALAQHYADCPTRHARHFRTFHDVSFIVARLAATQSRL